MIVELLIKLAIFFMNIATKILPNWSIPGEFINAFSTFGIYVMKMNSIRPLRAFINVLIIIGTYTIILKSYRLIIGLISLIRGGGGQGLTQ